MSVLGLEEEEEEKGEGEKKGGGEKEMRFQPPWWDAQITSRSHETAAYSFASGLAVAKMYF